MTSDRQNRAHRRTFLVFETALQLLLVMVCPSCSATLDGDGVCELCSNGGDGIGEDATVVGPDVQSNSTMAYSSGGQHNRAGHVGQQHLTLDSSHEMSAGATLPGAQRAAAARVAPARKSKSHPTTLGTSASIVGERLGSYRLIEVLGEGGMGRVYLAEHTRIGRRVALKMLHPHLARSPDVIRRFFDEARAVNRILHEHIVEITDFIENDGGANYFIMEYLRGAPLSDLLNRQDRVSALARSLSIGVQVSSALSAVHAADIVHRDLKPENIFITERGGQKDFVKLLDFGIAKLMGENGGEMNLLKTEAGVVMGTPAYMSPEQASAKSVDHRTDIYALGVILYELCTGVLPFIADNFGDLVVMHKTVQPLRPAKVPGLLQEIPAPLDDLIMRCLAKEPDDRPQSAKEVEERLHEIAWEFAVELESFDVSAGFIGQRTGRGRKAILAVGLGLAAAAALAVVVSLKGNDKAAHSEPREAIASEVARKEAAALATPEVQKIIPAQVRVSFTSEPAGAIVFAAEDRVKPLGITPFELALDMAEGVAQFEFRKDGFESTTHEVSRASDGLLHAQLTALALVPEVVSEGTKVAKERKRHNERKERRERKLREKALPKERDKPKQTYREGAVIDPFAR